MNKKTCTFVVDFSLKKELLGIRHKPTTDINSNFSETGHGR